MAIRPIPFTGPMVRAILRDIAQPGTGKTQTRRRLSKARVFATPEAKAFTLSGGDLARALQNASGFRHLHGDGWFWESDAFEWQAPAERTGWMAHIGYAPGDRLWVKEAIEQANGEAVGYPADGTWLPNTPWVWKNRNLPSMYMPRRLSRITLIVEDVRVERLQDISEADAIAEGIQCDTIPDGLISTGAHQSFGFPGYSGFSTAVEAYAVLWNTLYAAPGERWDNNPWIVAITFRPIMGNIEEVQP